MVAVNNSVLLRFVGAVCLWLVHQYEYSVLARMARSLSNGWSIAAKESVFLRVLLREGVFARSFSNSMLYKVSIVVINLPLILMRWLHQRYRMICDNSVSLQFVFRALADIPILISWLIFAIIILPYDHWNNAYSLVGFAFISLLTMLSFSQHKTRRLDVKALGPYPIFLWGSILLAYPLSSYVGLSARFVYYHLACILCVIVIVSTVKEVRQLVRLASMATLGLCFVSLYAIVQRLQGIEVNPSYVDLTLNAGMPGRVFSVFENPNAFGEVLVLLVPVALGLIFTSKNWIVRALGASGFVLGSMALIMTYSRAGWIGIAVAIALFVFFYNPRYIPVLILLGLLALPFLPDVILNRIGTMFNMSDTSTASRFPLYEAVLRLIALEPITGAGLGSDAVRTFVKDNHLYFGASPFVHGHNVYLQLWAEAGIIALISLLASMGWMLKKVRTIMAKRMETKPEHFIMAASASAVFGILVCGLADFIWHYPRVMLLFFFVFSLAIAGMRLSNRKQTV